MSVLGLWVNLLRLTLFDLSIDWGLCILAVLGKHEPGQIPVGVNFGVSFEQDYIANNTQYPLDIRKLHMLVFIRKLCIHFPALIIISSDDITFAWS